MKIKIIVTAKELIDRSAWQDFCENRAISQWAVNEGLMDSVYEFELTKDEAIKYGFMTEKPI